MAASTRNRWLGGGRAAYAAAGLSLALGLAFIFVRAPHPWGWEGIDHYRDLALTLARGEPYPTLDRMWGYPLFLAAFYRVFGDRPWIPLLVQAIANATIPLLVFIEARRRIDERTARLAALLAGALSFNTIYASTQASDSLCTVFFVASVVAFDCARDTGSTPLFTASGLLAALALLFRPNLLLWPPVLVAADWLTARRPRQLRQTAAFGAAVIALWAPWPIRNYQLTDRFIPATTHGGVQMWDGSLQVGPYVEDWFDNPRVALESSPFDYSLPSRQPLVVTAEPAFVPRPIDVWLTYWTDRRAEHVRLAPMNATADRAVFSIPPPPATTALYYYFDATWRTAEGSVVEQSTPVLGARDPYVHVVSSDHFGDLDLHGDLLDAFDIVRLLRHEAWHEPLPASPRLDLDRDGRVTRNDLDLAVGALVVPAAQANRPATGKVKSVESTADAVRLTLADGSSITVPRVFQGRTIDLDVRGTMAADLMRSRRSFVSLTTQADEAGASPLFTLRGSVNKVFWHEEPRQQDRYALLALANIRHSPGAFAAASVRRIARLFVVVGSDDAFRTAQFRYGRYIFAAGTLLSLTYVGLFLAGVVIAWRRRFDVVLPVLAILYIPATIFTVLVTMRFTVTVQPFVFIFVATALVTAGDAVRRG